MESGDEVPYINYRELSHLYRWLDAWLWKCDTGLANGNHWRPDVGQRSYDGQNGVEMRTIYLGKSKSKCPSCGGYKISYPIGWTMGGKPLYSCKDKFHTKTIRRSEV